MYTAHGHHIPGTVKDAEKPLFVARCGGIQICEECYRDGARYLHGTVPNGDAEKEPSFHEELRQLLNRHSKENPSNTPDYILADYLIACLDIFGATLEQRDRWWGQPQLNYSESEKVMYEEETYIQKGQRLVFDYVTNHLEKTDTHATFSLDEVYVVWFSKTLQNWKALYSTTLPDGMYYEVTYNGDHMEAYLDAYKKFDNVRISDNEK